MMRQKEISKMMYSYGFYLARSRKHNIWKNESGEIIVASSTPSCPFAFHKIRRRLEKLNKQ